jgi:hypothetical protein
MIPKRLEEYDNNVKCNKGKLCTASIRHLTPAVMKYVILTLKSYTQVILSNLSVKAASANLLRTLKKQRKKISVSQNPFKHPELTLKKPRLT